VSELEETFGVSQRRACTVVGQPRTTQRLQPPVPTDLERELRDWLREFSKTHPRWGWKRAYHHLRREGRNVNKKRVQRLWRLEGLKVPYRKRKKPLRGLGAPVGAMCPIRPNAIWALDFQFDETTDGRALKFLNIIDEFTRECLATHVDTSITADHLCAVLDRLVLLHGTPAFLRCDHGPEFVAYALADWCRFNNAATTFIDPGSPWQNAWVESFNSRFRDELLNSQLFDSVLEAKFIVDDWRAEYNLIRLHSSLGYVPPVEFKQTWEEQHQQRPLLALAN
jgi:putative transposase